MTLPPPLTPNTADATSESVAVTAVPLNPPATSPYPMRVRIPSIALNSPIENMGVVENGQLDVPDGSTKNVGWYQGGTTPGNAGSAVLDAHVFAAFARLHDLKVGSDIYIDTSANTTLHFVVQETDTYALSQVPLQQLFNRDDAPRLNLITCAGKLTPDRSTYDHRLVVYARLDGN